MGKTDEIKKAGVMYLGQFIKAVMEHKTICIHKHRDAIYTYNREFDIYVDDENRYGHHRPEEFIAYYIDLIYSLSYTYEILEDK